MAEPATRMERLMLRVIDLLEADSIFDRLVVQEIAQRGLSQEEGWPLVFRDVMVGLSVVSLDYLKPTACGRPGCAMPQPHDHFAETPMADDS